MAAIKTPVKLASGPQHSLIKEHFTGHVTLHQHKMIPVSDTYSSQETLVDDNDDDKKHSLTI